MNNQDIESLIGLLREAAQAELMPRFRKVVAQYKADGSLVTEADLAMQNAVSKRLQRDWPQFGFLGEEMPAEQHEALLSKPGAGLWVLDPLDGTINFASGIPLFSVSLALIDTAGVVMGIIYDPVRDECFSAQRGKGATLNGHPLQAGVLPSRLDECVAEVDLKRLSVSLRTELLTAQPFRSQRNFGSGALDWAWLAAGRFQVYLHGGQKLWDYAAGVLILQEAGGRSCTLDEDAVFNHGLAPRSVVAAANLDLFALWGACVMSSDVNV